MIVGNSPVHGDGQTLPRRHISHPASFPTKASALAGLRPDCGVYRCGCGSWHAATIRQIDKHIQESQT